MKKFLVVSLALVLVLGCLSGCFFVRIDKPVTDILKPQDESVQKLPEEKPVIETLPTVSSLPELQPAMDMNDPISEIYDLAMTDDYGYTATYNVPQINCDSADAQRINAEIEEVYGGILEEELQHHEEGVSFICEYIKWWTVPNGEYSFALIVSCLYPGGNEYFSVYNFDGMSGREIKNEEILTHFGLTEEEFLDLTRSAAEAYFVDSFSSMSDDPYYEDRLEFTVADEQIHSGLPMFINETGGLSVIAEIGSLAGADAYSRIIEIYG